MLFLNDAVCLRFVVVVAAVYGAAALQYQCRDPYEPGQHKGELRVPPGCQVSIPPTCPPSWKAGVPKGTATSLPLIYTTFITCHEGFTNCGYVPIDPKTGEVLGQSGVTVGAGVDLGALSATSPVLVSISNTTISNTTISNTTVSRLEPYFGLKRDSAACAAMEKPLLLTELEAMLLTDTIKANIAQEVATRYNREKSSNAKSFDQLPRGIRTAVVSVWFQFGLPPAYPRFWGYVTRNEWKNAVKELRNFYSNPSSQARGDVKRRNNEADIIKATFNECYRSADVVVLLDESGSIDAHSFNESLVFVEELVKAYPDDKLGDEHGTRFALSSFSGYYRTHFRLSWYKSQSQYIAAINRVRQRVGLTYLGGSLIYVLPDQFASSREHFPKILIVLTDGVSFDAVGAAAERVRNENIVIYAIGIGNYDESQLRELASEQFADSRIFTLSNFDELTTLFATITAAACNEPQPTDLEEPITTVTNKDEYQYFLFEVNATSNLVVQITDNYGATAVFASRSNPHPYKYDNDIKFETSSQKNKVMVIAPVERTQGTTRRKRDTSSGNSTEQAIYVSVQGAAEQSSFTILASLCDPRICTEGTNEVVKRTNKGANAAFAAVPPAKWSVFACLLGMALLSFY